MRIYILMGCNKRIFFAFITLCISLSILSQIPKNEIIKPNFIPQSPTAAGYARYGEIPVDFSTGVPKIEIPIYAIQLGDVSVPISISYHASGIKVKDTPSEVGLGWVLNIGGNVTANILGAPDVRNLKPFDYRRSEDIDHLLSTANDYQSVCDISVKFYKDINKRQYIFKDGSYNSASIDFFSDRFSYSLPTGENGVFRKDFVCDSIRLLPYRPLKVCLNSNSVNFISANGVRSYFKLCNYDTYDLYMPDKIVATNKVDSLQYYYGHSNIYPLCNVSETYSWNNNNLRIEKTLYECESVTGVIGGDYHNGPVTTICSGPTQYVSILPDSIVSKNIVIKFTYANDRTDLCNITPYNNRLIKIEIKDKYSSAIFKSFQFYQSYFGTSASNNKRLRLDSISICGVDSKKYDTYKFKYNQLELPPYPTLSPNSGMPSEDYWGYYNGTNNSYFPNFIKDLNIPGIYSYNVGNREPDSAFMKACLIREITYPTGGRTLFEFEPNSESSFDRVGGLRVSQITSYENSLTKATTHKYKYGNRINKIIEPVDYGYLDEQIHQVFYYNTNKCDLVLHQVGEYLSYTVNSESLAQVYNSNGTTAMYGMVSEYLGKEDENTGMNQYEYRCQNPNEQIYTYTENLRPRYINSYHNDYGNYQPILLKKTAYKNENNSYIPVNSVEYQYKDYKQKEFNSGIILDSNISLEIWGDGCCSTYEDALRLFCFGGSHPNSYSDRYLTSLKYLDTKGHEDISLLDRTIEWDNNGVSKTTIYEYDNYSQLSKKTVIGSKKENITTKIKYPYDFAGSGNVYELMVNKFIINPTVEEVKGQDNTPTESTRTNYISFNNMIFPESIDIKKGSYNYETRLTYNSYDEKGNVTQYTQSDGKVITLFWAYNKSLPVAKIESGDLLSIPTELRTEIANNIYDAVGLKDKIDQNINFLKSKLNNYMIENNCMVTLYTYKPLVGMTSQTAPNGITTYYNYDSFNRLQNIKDNNSKYLNEYRYHYYNQ